MSQVLQNIANRRRTYKGHEIVNVGLSWYVGDRHFLTLAAAKRWISALGDAQR